MSSKYSASNKSDMIEFESQSSADEIVEERPERLHEWLSCQEIQSLHRVFVTHPQQKLGYSELREALENFNIKFTPIEYNRLFLKINQNRDFKCDWNEFISYLIFGFQEDDPSSQKEALILPISSPPLIRKSEHRSPICALTLLRISLEDPTEEIKDPTIASEESPEVDGMWLTASREGQIRFWTPHLELVRCGISESIHLKMATWILAIQALSDISILCTSSTERELRFHETVVSTFSLRVIIRSLPYAVCCMAYSFNATMKTDSKLVLGDYGGHVRILHFTPILRGPFQSKPGSALIDIHWVDLLKGKGGFKVQEFLNIHSELIEKVFFSMRMNCLFTCAEYRNTKKYRGRCPGLVIAGSEEKTTFRIPLGVTTFFLDERNNIIVTGGPDTFVRIWDVYISAKPSGILTGHNGGIVMVFVQSDEKKVYSVDYQKIIKVWHLTEFNLLQTYADLVRIIPSETDLVYHYHTINRELVIGGRKIVVLKCCPRVRVDLTDGNTHAAPISVVLYNRLFRNIVTCGLDSYIIVWDPWTGRRKIIMKNCHTKIVYGQTIDIEITAACFDPLDQFLLTGARDGSLKIWNYNNAVCIRNMSIKNEHEVTAVIWVVERILAVGWDKQVTEFNDVEGREYGDPKKWTCFHGDDITCADVKLGEGVVTATYSGEIIFWKLETGQPYRRYSVIDPTKFIELKYEAPKVDVATEGDDAGNISVSRYVRRSISSHIRYLQNKWQASTIPGITRIGSILDEDIDDEAIAIAKISESIVPLSVQAVLFLQTRPMTKEHGSVFVALDTGMIQVYSHHQRGGYISQFNSVHKTGDCVLTMTTDRKNSYLFTGTAFGYIKIWLIKNYCIPLIEKQPVVMPLLRLRFIFLRKEKFLTRAKRIVRHQLEPLLVSSYKGHLKAVNSIVYINLPKILLSGSHDCSCRLWSLGGRYLGTLGTPLTWLKLSPFEPVNEENSYRIPPDIKKVASSTTMKVISGIQVDQIKINLKDTKAEEADTAEDEDTTRIYGKPLREPILGKHFKLPGKSATEQRVELDTSLSYIPVYTHLKIHEGGEISIPSTPRALTDMNNESFMEFYMPKKRTEEEDEKDCHNVEVKSRSVLNINSNGDAPKCSSRRSENEE